MTRESRGYLAVCAALVGFALAYALPGYARLPNLYYDPVARRFFVGLAPGPVPLGYFGQIGYGLVGAAIFALAIGLGTRFLRREPSRETIGLAAAWALTFLLLVGAYLTWNNWPSH